MGFIKASVGSGGVNNMAGVKVVQWLLNQAEDGYHFMSDLAQEDINSPGIKENGVVSPSTQIAIENWASFCDNVSLPKDKPPMMRGIKLEPDNQYYKRLVFGVVIQGTGEVLVNDGENYQDPRVKQALDGRINFEQFKFLIENTKKETLTELGKQMQKLAKDPKVRAFLEVIAYAEGTDRDIDPALSGYSTMMGYETAPNLYSHPGRVAAGRYQAIPSTWGMAQKALGLYDFTPESQEIFGAWNLAKNRPRILEFLNQDNFPAAVEEASNEWASFPNRSETGKDPETDPTSRYKYSRGPKRGQRQPAPYKLSELKKVYIDSLAYFREIGE